MHYLTNYYKNLCEQLQQQINLLESKVQLLNEIGDTPAGRDALQNYIMRVGVEQFAKGRGSKEEANINKNRARTRIKAKGDRAKMKEILADQGKVFDEMEATGQITSPEQRANLERSGQGPFTDAFVARETGALEAAHPRYHTKKHGKK
jgi:hypothetical protein